MPGKGKLIITGKLGEVMQESAQAAMSYVRSRAERFGIDKNFNEKLDVHIHVPEGAIPKDGPSAGITMTTALISSLARIPVRRDLAMTGEITLRGRVLPIGGLKEKAMAAHRGGIRTILIPSENKKDIREIPKKVREELRIIPVEHMDEVLKLALVLENPETFLRAEPGSPSLGRRRCWRQSPRSARSSRRSDRFASAISHWPDGADSSAVEQRPYTAPVAGSIPAPPTKKWLGSRGL